MMRPDDWYMTKRASEADDLRNAHNQREDRVGGPLIEGIYHPHLVDGPGTLPIETSISALGQTYLTAIAGFLAEVSMPRLDLAYKQSGPLAPPRFNAYGDDFDWSDAQFPSEPRLPKWGKNAGSGRVIIRDFRLAVDPGDTAPKDASRAVQGAIGDWWRLAKTWIEISRPKTSKVGTGFIGQGARWTFSTATTQAATGTRNCPSLRLAILGGQAWCSE